MDFYDNLPSVSFQDLSLPNSSEFCRVCGKPAAGQHYDVQTCHGCKSFFRRATLSNIRYNPCIRNQECYSNVFPGKLPRKCNKCRIRKCFSVGMIPFALTSRRSDIISINYPEKNLQFMTQEEAICKIIDQLFHLELQVEIFRKSAYNPVDFPSLDDVLNSTSILSSGQRYGTMPGWPLCMEEFSMKQLQLHNSVQKFALKNSNFKGNVKNWLAFDILATIEYAKTFKFFHRLSHNDKLCLIKATTFMNYELMRVFDTFSYKSENIRLPDGTLLHEVVSAAMNNKNMGALVAKVSEKAIEMMVRVRFEKEEYVLLKAIVFCNNVVANLSLRGQKIIQRERHKYCSALFSYCITRYNVKNGPARFGAILSMVDVLERSQRDLRHLFLFQSVNRDRVPGAQSNPTSLAAEISNPF